MYIIYKGYLNNYSLDYLFEKLKNFYLNNKKLSNLFEKVDGHYALIFMRKRKCIVVADRISSIPILIKKISNKILLADNFTNLMKAADKKGKDLHVDDFQAKHFAMSGYTSGNRSF